MHFYFFGSNNYNRQQKDAQRLLILVYSFINISNASTFINVISSINTIIRPLTIQWTECSKLTDLPRCKRYSRNLFNGSLYDKNWYNWNRHFKIDLSVRLYIYFIVYSIIYSLYILLFNYHSMSYYMGTLLGQYFLIKYLSIQLNIAVSEFFFLNGTCLCLSHSKLY